MPDTLVSIEFNGQTQQVAIGTTIADLLRQANIETRFIAVEVNLEVIPRQQHGNYQVQPGDSVEVVTLVGGG